MFGLNSSQIAAVSERVFYALSPMLISYGLYSEADAPMVASVVVAIVGAVVGIINNRQSRLADRAAKLPGTTIVTDPAIAAKAKSANVVSNREQEVVSR